MVTIRDIECLDVGESIAEEGRVFSAALPENMTYLIVTGDVAIWLLRGHDLAHASLDHILVLTEGEENGSDIGTLDIGQLCPVSLFLGQGQLVSLNSVLLVIIDGGEANQTKLCMITHGLLVDVHALLSVLDKVAMLDEVKQVLTTSGINLVGVWILILSHGYFWLVDVEEAHFIAISHGTSLNSVEGVVGR